MKILTLAAYIALITVNYLANALPIGGVTTGQASDSYGNLFTPAGYTFSIWGLIYLLLAGYTVYLFVKKNKKTEELIKRINPLFIATSFANISWIFAWHYNYIWLSLIIMAVLLVLLIMIADILRTGKYTSLEILLILTPFSVYFGWITVASIANVTVFLASLNWNGFGIADFIWTSIVLLVGALIGILRMVKDKNIAYGSVLIWAYFGILFKHISDSGFNAQYPSIIITVVICLVLFGFFTGRLINQK